MARKKLLIHIIVLMFFIFLTDKAAGKFYWYNSIWYFDMIMHFLGGVWVGLFFIYTLSVDEASLKSLWRVVLLTLLIGVSWEVYEFVVNNMIGRVPFDILDTLSDIFWDVAGGLVSLFYFSKIIMMVRGNKIQ